MNTLQSKAVWLDTGEECKASDMDLAMLRVIQLHYHTLAQIYELNIPCGFDHLTDAKDPGFSALLHHLEGVGLVSAVLNENWEQVGCEYKLLAGFKELM